MMVSPLGMWYRQGRGRSEVRQAAVDRLIAWDSPASWLVNLRMMTLPSLGVLDYELVL